MFENRNLFMKFKILFVLFISCCFTPESSKAQVISSLNFPYKVGYSLSLKGNAITYKMMDLSKPIRHSLITILIMNQTLKENTGLISV